MNCDAGIALVVDRRQAVFANETARPPVGFGRNGKVVPSTGNFDGDLFRHLKSHFGLECRRYGGKVCVTQKVPAVPT